MGSSPRLPQPRANRTVAWVPPSPPPSPRQRHPHRRSALPRHPCEDLSARTSSSDELPSSSKPTGAMAAKKLTLLQTVTAAGVFSAVSFWYGFMFGRESARRELAGIIDDLRGSCSPSAADAASSDSHTHAKP